MVDKALVSVSDAVFARQNYWKYGDGNAIFIVWKWGHANTEEGWRAVKGGGELGPSQPNDHYPTPFLTILCCLEEGYIFWWRIPLMLTTDDFFKIEIFFQLDRRCCCPLLLLPASIPPSTTIDGSKKEAATDTKCNSTLLWSWSWLLHSPIDYHRWFQERRRNRY